MRHNSSYVYHHDVTCTLVYVLTKNWCFYIKTVNEAYHCTIAKIPKNDLLNEWSDIQEEVMDVQPMSIIVSVVVRVPHELYLSHSSLTIKLDYKNT